MAKPKPNTKRGKTELTLDPRNARKHSARNLSTIERSLKEVGGGRSILVDGDNIIRAGNGVYTKAQSLGLRVRVVDAKPDELIAVRRTDLRGKQAIRAAVLDNLAADSSAHEYDADILAAIVRDDDVVRALAQDDAAITKLLKDTDAFGAREEATDAGELVDRAAELQEKWQVKRGDLWQCGKHLILCGDSTNADDVARVMQGEKAQLAVTSPPYFNQREYAQWKTYEDYLSFVSLVVGETSRNLCDDAVFAVNIGSDEQARRWMPSDWWCILRDSDESWLYRECIAWVKAAAVWNVPRSMHIENGHYFPALRWEVILVVSRGKHPKFEQADRDTIREFDENVWQIAVVSGNEQKAIGHNAPFPIEIPRRLILAYTTKNKLIYEPFLGSGSTLAACEQTGRIGAGVEISEKYVAVSLERLSLLGLEPCRVEG